MPPGLGDVVTPGMVDPASHRLVHLADDLARLMYDLEREEIYLSLLAELVPEEFAGHWHMTVEFLKIVTEQWPRFLDEHGLASPVAST